MIEIVFKPKQLPAEQKKNKTLIFLTMEDF